MSLSAITPIQQDHAFLNQAFSRLPGSWQNPVSSNYKKQFKAKGRTAANLAVLDTLDAVDGFRFGVASDDDALRSFSRARADECFRAAARYVDKDQALDAMRAVALRYGITPPAGRYVTLTGQRMRLLSEHWWRRNVRKTAGRNVEAAAIKVGLVSRVAGLYASDEAVKRRTGQRRRNREILSSITAMNSDGQEYNMQELSDLGTANPKMRRMELMTRIAGFDQVAIKYNHAAEFYTITAPSKYHARHHIHGRENPNYGADGNPKYTPAETQAYLCKVWARARAKLHRMGISFYGFRVAEPHHDGTPHWHALMFCEAQHVATIRAIIKHYAMQDDGHEPGADVHRFKAETIDRKRGSAAGYIAKYISKNIDGFEVGEDWEAVAGDDDATKTARRVDAWASTWGIRQFQQFGGQAVTVWRELRRADPATIEGERLRMIAEAADAGAWDRYTELNGGVLNKFYEFPRYSAKTGKPLTNGHRSIKEKFARLEKEGAINDETGEIRLNIYTEYAAPLVVGFRGGLEVIKTHLLEWVFKRNGNAVTPRSSVNNCTENDKKQFERDQKKMRIRYLREIKKRPAAGILPPVIHKTEFLTGEDLKAWEIQREATRMTA